MSNNFARNHFYNIANLVKIKYLRQRCKKATDADKSDDVDIVVDLAELNKNLQLMLGASS
jgi:hypothetical protein